MSGWTWDEAIAELEATAKCRCEPCWTDRGMHAPECQSDLAPVIEYLREYERQNVLYREIVVGEGTWQRFQALQARAEAAEQRVREVEALLATWKVRAERKRQCGLKVEASIDEARIAEIESALQDTGSGSADNG